MLTHKWNRFLSWGPFSSNSPREAGRRISSLPVSYTLDVISVRWGEQSCLGPQSHLFAMTKCIGTKVHRKQLFPHMPFISQLELRCLTTSARQPDRCQKAIVNRTRCWNALAQLKDQHIIHATDAPQKASYNLLKLSLYGTENHLLPNRNIAILHHVVESDLGSTDSAVTVSGFS